MFIDRRFALFLAATFLAGFGGWINFLAILNIATYRFGAGPFDLVILSALLLLPSVLLTRVIADVCERYRSTHVRVIVLAVTFCTTAALLQVGDFIAFLAVITLKSIALGFTEPAETCYVTTSLAEAQQSRAFRLLSLAQSVAKISAPAAGALIGARFGDDHVMRASMGLIGVAVVLMALSGSGAKRVASPATNTDPAESAAIEATMAQAASVESAPKTTLAETLLPLLVCASIGAALGAAVNNQFPLMLKRQGFDPSELGIVVSCSALGGMLGSLLPMGRNANRAGMVALVAPAMATCCVFIAIGVIFRLPIGPASVLLCAAFLATGMAGARFRIATRMFIARHLSDQVAGASARLQSAGMLAQFLAPCFGAVMVSRLSASATFLTLGIVAAAGQLVAAAVFGKEGHRHAARSTVTSVI